MGAGEEVEIDWGIMGGPDQLISMAQEPTTIRNAIGTGPGPWRVQLGHLQLLSRGLFDGENAANGAGHVVKKQGKMRKSKCNWTPFGLRLLYAPTFSGVFALRVISTPGKPITLSLLARKHARS